MPDLELQGLTKRYGALTAVDDLTARVCSGRITAFLGANGSGKTTTMRMLLGLSEADAGAALIGGRRYRDLAHPLQEVGAVLDQGFHPNRSARDHLRIVAAQAGLSDQRVDEVLAGVGLHDAARRRVGGYSLGMRQRLHLAAATIGRPATLVLDEPFNGLDPAGIQSTRDFLRDVADGGGTVLLSSHLLSEIAHCADDALVIDHGRLVGSGAVANLTPSTRSVLVSTQEVVTLGESLVRAGGEVHHDGQGNLTVMHLSAETIGRVARDAGAVVTQMRSVDDGLEAAFTALVGGGGAL